MDRNLVSVAIYLNKPCPICGKAWSGVQELIDSEAVPVGVDQAAHKACQSEQQINPDEREQAEKSHNEALENLRSDYEITCDTRTEAGVRVPEYIHWLEDQVVLYQSLVKYYQQSAVHTPFDASDNLRLCKVCRDRETTRGDSVCETCHDQWVIDQM